MTRPERQSYPQLCLRLELLRLALEAGLADELLASLRRTAMGGEPFLSVQTPTGVVLLPLSLEVSDL